MTSTCPNGHTSTADDYCDVCGAPIGAGAAPVATAAVDPATSAGTGAGGQLCPNCTSENVADALFCEACGYDFTTGTMPRSAVPLTPPEGFSPAAPLLPPDGPPPSAGGETLSPTGTPTGDGAGSSAPDHATAAPAVSGGGSPAAGAQPTAPAAESFGWVAEVWIDPAWYEVQESPDALPSAGLPAIVPLHGRSVLVGRKSRSRNIHPDVDCEPDTGTSRRQAQLTTDGTRWWVEDLESANGTFVGGASDPLPEDPIPVGVKRELDPDDRIYVGAWTRIVIRQATDEEKAALG